MGTLGLELWNLYTLSHLSRTYFLERLMTSRLGSNWIYMYPEFMIHQLPLAYLYSGIVVSITPEFLRSFMMFTCDVPISLSSVLRGDSQGPPWG